MKPQQKAWAHKPDTDPAKDPQSKCEGQESKKLNSPNKPGDRGMCEKQTPVQGGEFA